LSNIIVNSTSSQSHVLLAIPVIVTLNPLINCDVPGKQQGSGQALDELLELLEDDNELDELTLLDDDPLEELLLDDELLLDEELPEELLEDELDDELVQQHDIEAGSGIMCTHPLRSKCLHFATHTQPQS
jgi:hypothetical protein